MLWTPQCTQCPAKHAMRNAEEAVPLPGAVRPKAVLPCCLEVPPRFEAKAWYALRMLLLPLGLAPERVGRSALAAPGLYYGPEPEGLPERVVALPLREATVAFFEARVPYHAGEVRWMEGRDAHDRWPALFGGGHRAEHDLIASAFFWLSGWQEHTVRTRDRHGRFPWEASLQRRLGTTTRPPVDAYREALAERLLAAGVPVHPRRWAGHAWAFCPTHDVDYLRKWRPGMVWREVVHHLALNRRRDPPGTRLRRFGRFLADLVRPGDVFRRAFERMPAETARRGGTATFFLKTGAHGPHDVPYDGDGAYVRARVQALEAGGFEVGLHPSYHAFDHPGYLREEYDRLARLTAAPPVSVRTHYLRFDPVLTPRLLVATGFRIDSTLGFADHEGFRHGTCLPFQLYDVAADRPLDLWEMPLAFMESVLFNRRGLDGEQALAVTRDLLATCRRFGGVAVGLWHNTLWDELDFPGWGDHFTATLDEAATQGAYIASLRDALAAFLA